MTLTQMIAQEIGIILIASILWILGIYSHQNNLHPDEEINLPKFVGNIFGKSTNPYNVSGIAIQLLAIITVIVFNFLLFNIVITQVAIRIYGVLFLMLGIIVGIARFSQRRKSKQ